MVVQWRLVGITRFLLGLLVGTCVWQLARNFPDFREGDMCIEFGHHCALIEFVVFHLLPVELDSSISAGSDQNPTP